MRKRTCFGFSLLLSLSVVVFAGEVDYTNLTFARLSYITGNAYIQRASDLGYEAAVVNMPITEGDRVETDEGRAEIHLGSGVYLRMDYRTKVDFLDLPKRGSELTRLRQLAGHTYISVNRWDRDQPLEIHTMDVSLYILERGLYRIDVRENRETEILVFQGLAEAAGDGGSALLKSGQRIEAAGGYFTSNPSPFSLAALDGFDRWSEIREELLHRRLAQSYLPYELEDYEYELGVSGRWTYVSPFGFVWIPRSVGVSWRPYYRGRWAWYPMSGWTWIPYESWGWVTCHYGRWHWRLDLGWYWIPTKVWGPGWVSWQEGRDHYGWAPLTYYGRPAVIVNNHFYADYSGPSYPPNSRALTVVAKNQLKAKDVSRVALTKESLSSSSARIRMSDGIPDPGPAAKRMSIQKLEKDKRFLRVNRESSAGSAKESSAKMSVTPRRIKTTESPKTPADRSQKSVESGRARSSINRIYDSVTKSQKSSRTKSSGSSTESSASKRTSSKTVQSTPRSRSSSAKSTEKKSTRSSSSKSSSQPTVRKSSGSSSSKSTVRKSSNSPAKKSTSSKASRSSGSRIKKKKK